MVSKHLIPAPAESSSISQNGLTEPSVGIETVIDDSRGYADHYLQPVVDVTGEEPRPKMLFVELTD